MLLSPQKIILWLDDALVAVNKPAGLPSLPDGYHPELPNVLNTLEPVYGKLWVVHRLDRQTSGVLILARSAQAHRWLSTQFEARQTEKIYHALVVGNPPWDETRVDQPLRPNAGHRHRTVPDSLGKPAITNLRVLERLGGFTLVEAIPETGRTHQIRAHLAFAGFPIAADELYGGGQAIFESDPNPEAPPEAQPLLDRVGLHARSLSIYHPLTHERTTFEAPYPEDLDRLLMMLRK